MYLVSYTWTATVRVVTENYPHEKAGSHDTFFLNYVPPESGPAVAWDGLEEKILSDIGDEPKYNHVSWIQLSLHKQGKVDEDDPLWAHSHHFRTRTKIWRVKHIRDAVKRFRKSIQNKAQLSEEVYSE